MPIRARQVIEEERLVPNDEPIEFRELRPSDYEEVRALWLQTEGLVLREADEREPALAYLAKNEGLSFVAVDGGRIIGAALTGTDGRRGYVQHVAVAPGHRRRGVGRGLVERTIAALAARGIDKTHLMVLPGNAAARAFWARLGWQERGDVLLLSFIASGRPNA